MLRSIAYNFPGFQDLPRGIKKMLVVTESHFFGEENARARADVRRLSILFPPPVIMVKPRVSVAAAWRI